MSRSISRTSAVTLLIASLVYLAFELIFNVTLLDAASAKNISLDLKEVEQFGRVMSGIGFALLVIGFYASNQYYLDKYKFVSMSISLLAIASLIVGWLAFDFVEDIHLALIVLPTLSILAVYRYTGKSRRRVILIGLTAFIAMFFGQKTLLEVYIENSSWETRATAQYMSLLKSGLQEGVIEIEGLPFDSDSEPEKKTFLALMGGVVMGSPEFLEGVRQKKKQIIHKLVEKNGSEDFNDQYDEYLRAGSILNHDWMIYANASKDYDSVVNDRHAADKAFIEVLQEREKMFTAYQSAVEDINRSSTSGSGELYDQLNKMYRKYNGWCTRNCKDDLESRYESKMKSMFGQSLGKTLGFLYWCDGSNAVEPNPIMGGVRGVGTRCFRNNSFNTSGVKKKLVKLKKELFFKNTGYTAKYYNNKLAFFNSEATSQKIRDKLKEQGFELSSQWTYKDRKDFLRAYDKTFVLTAKDRWRKTIAEGGAGYLPPMLTYEQFMSHPVTLAGIKKEMGSRYVDGMSFEMSKSQFKKKMIDPKVEKKVLRSIDALEKDAIELGNNGKNEKQGKSFLRSILIPPIALLLSLSMVILTLGKSGASLIKLAGLSDKKSKIAQFLFIGGALLTITVAPFFLENSFTQSKAFTFFDTSTESSLWSGATQWVMRMEPVAYPLGKKVEALDYQKLKALVIETVNPPRRN